MAKIKLKINSKEAVKLIREGKTDIFLMQKYGLSARGLEKLFTKLVVSGQLAHSEFDDRLLFSQRSHVVDLVDYSSKSLKKTKVNADDAIAGIRAGLSDIELMEKYNISARGLDSLFRKLVEAGSISMWELENKRGVSSAVKTPAIAETENRFSEEDLDEDNGGDEISAEPPSPRNRFILAGMVGALAGVLIFALFLLFVMGTGPFRQLFSGTKTVASDTDRPFAYKPEDVIAILESISGRKAGGVDPELSPLQDCFKNCEKDHNENDDAERLLLINCKRQCLSMHSERFKKLRKQYY